VDPVTGSTLYAGDTELHQAAGSSTVSATRTYAGAGGVPVAERDTVAGQSGSTLYWLFTDVDGTPVVQVNSSTGAVAHRYTDPFGNPVGAAPTGWADDHGFLNKVQDADTGLTLVGARDYDTGLGRFTSADPILAPQDPVETNGFQYADNDPVSLADPTGMDPAMRQCVGADMVACENYYYGGGSTPSGKGIGAYLASVGAPTDLNVTAANACGWHSECVNNQPDRYQAGQTYHPKPNSLSHACTGLLNCLGRIAGAALSACAIICSLVGPEVGALAGGLEDGIAAADAPAFVTGAAGGSRFVASSDGSVTDLVGSHDAISLWHMPSYVENAQMTGARTFSISDDAWDAMTPTEQWLRNKHFLDNAIDRNSEIQLATPLDQIRSGSYLEREVTYMISRGYVPNSTGTLLIRGTTR
jgi:RHS repeat-associated protein